MPDPSPGLFGPQQTMIDGYLIPLSVPVTFRRLEPAAIPPAVAHLGDLCADIHALEGGTIPADSRQLVRTGIVIALPYGFGAWVHSRSGLALKHGIEAGAGTIDNNYTGDGREYELHVLLHNTSHEPWSWEAGDRIAQLEVKPYWHPTFHEAEHLEERGRRGGFGTSGRKAIAYIAPPSAARPRGSAPLSPFE